MGRGVGAWSERHRGVVSLVFDLVCWVAGLLLALAIRFGFEPTSRQVRAVLLFAPLLLVLQAMIGDFAGIYRGDRWRRNSLHELFALAGSTFLATAAAAAFNASLADKPVPHSVPLAGGMLALMGMIVVRSVRSMIAAEQREVPDAEVELSRRG